MESTIASLRNTSQFFSSSFASVDDGGAVKLPDWLSRELNEVDEFLRRGPAIDFLKDGVRGIALWR